MSPRRAVWLEMVLCLAIVAVVLLVCFWSRPAPVVIQRCEVVVVVLNGEPVAQSVCAPAPSQAVPEPGTLALLGTGLVALALLRRVA